MTGRSGSSAKRCCLGLHLRRGNPDNGARRRHPVGIRRLANVALCAIGIVLGSSTLAAAYFSLTSTGPGAAQAGAIGAPETFTANPTSPNDVTLSWKAPSNPTRTGYTLAGTIGAGSFCTSTPGGTVTSCTVKGLTQSTTYTWHLVAKDHTWSSTQVTASATTFTPTITVPPTAGVGGTVVKVTGSHFAPSSHLTFAFTSAAKTTTALTPTNCTPTSTATGTLPATPCEVTIPAGAATGGGTVTVTDATGNMASAPFTVTMAGGLGTMTVAPTTVINASTGNSLTFTYTVTGGALADGQVDLSVASWLATGGTVPQTTTASAAGYTVSSTGTLAYTATTRVLKVTGVTLSPNETFTITYGEGGGASGVRAPAPAGTSVPYTITASQSSTALGALEPLATSPVVTVIKVHVVTCSSPFDVTLPAGVTVPFSVVGGGGGTGGTATGSPTITAGAGGAGAAVSGTLTNTTGSPVRLSVLPGCAGGNGGTSPGSGGTGYANGGGGGQGHGDGGSGGGGGGSTSIQIVSTGTYLVVAGGGGGGGGGVSSKGGQTGESGGSMTATSTSPGAANGTPGGTYSTGDSAGGGGGGGGAGNSAMGGTATKNTAGGGGAAGASYPTGTFSVGGVNVSNLSYGTGVPGASGSATLGS